MTPEEKIISQHTSTVIHYLQQLERLNAPNAKDTLDFFLHKNTITKLLKELSPIGESQPPNVAIPVYGEGEYHFKWVMNEWVFDRLLSYE